MRFASADVVNEALINGAPLRRVSNFGMKLNGIESARFICHCRQRRGFVRGNDREARRQFGDLVAVRHPHIEQAVAFRIGAVLNAFEQPRVSARPHFGIAELAHQAAFNFATQLRRHRLHAVADAQYRHTEVEYDLRRACGVLLDYRRMAAGKNDAVWIEIANVGIGHVERVQLAIDTCLAHPARDELGDLRTEIEDKDFVDLALHLIRQPPV